MTLATNPLKFLRGHVRTVPGNMHVKFEVRSLNWSDWPVRSAQTHTHTQTHIERKQYLRHTLRSL